MIDKNFFDKVVQLRSEQKGYFKFRTPDRLQKCKALEREVDNMIVAEQHEEYARTHGGRDLFEPMEGQA